MLTPHFMPITMAHGHAGASTLLASVVLLKTESQKNSLQILSGTLKMTAMKMTNHQNCKTRNSKTFNSSEAATVLSFFLRCFEKSTLFL